MLLTLVPAYGRDYKSKKSVLADWNNGKDFTICTMMSPDDGRYINLSDAQTAKMETVNIRYNSLRSIAVVKIASPPVTLKKEN